MVRNGKTLNFPSVAATVEKKASTFGLPERLIRTRETGVRRKSSDTRCIAFIWQYFIHLFAVNHLPILTPLGTPNRFGLQSLL
jgi:hypothetical protein